MFFLAITVSFVEFALQRTYFSVHWKFKNFPRNFHFTAVTSPSTSGSASNVITTRHCFEGSVARPVWLEITDFLPPCRYVFLFFHPTSSAHTYTRTHTQRFTRFRVLQRLVSKNLLFSFDFSTLDYLRFWTVLYTSSTSASLLLQNTSLLLVSSLPPPPLTLQQHRHEGSATQGVIILDPIRESAERLERARAKTSDKPRIRWRSGGGHSLRGHRDGGFGIETFRNQEDARSRAIVVDFWRTAARPRRRARYFKSVVGSRDSRWSLAAGRRPGQRERTDFQRSSSSRGVGALRPKKTIKPLTGDDGEERDPSNNVKKR